MEKNGKNGSTEYETRAKAQLVAKRHQRYKLIKVEQNADYELNKAIAAALEKLN